MVVVVVWVIPLLYLDSGLLDNIAIHNSIFGTMTSSMNTLCVLCTIRSKSGP